MNFRKFTNSHLVLNIYINLCSSDSQRSVLPKVLKGNITGHKTKVLKLDPITAFVKTYANVKNNFDLSFFLVYI